MAALHPEVVGFMGAGCGAQGGGRGWGRGSRLCDMDGSCGSVTWGRWERQHRWRTAATRASMQGW